jgi:hypothetical protein
MEREYVTAPIGEESAFTITAIADRYGRGKSSVARMSRIKEWKRKRDEHRRQTGAIVSELDSDTYAARISKLHGDFVEAAEKTVAAYVKAVDAGEITPSAGDVAKMVTTVQQILAGHAGGEQGDKGDGDIRIPGSLGRDFIGALEGIARERLASAPVAGPAEPKPVGPSSDGHIQVR